MGGKRQSAYHATVKRPSELIVDTAATANVVSENWLASYAKALAECGAGVIKRRPASAIFRFGNNTETRATADIPISISPSDGMMRAYLLPAGISPSLLSRAEIEQLSGAIDFANHSLELRGLSISVPPWRDSVGRYRLTASDFGPTSYRGQEELMRCELAYQQSPLPPVSLRSECAGGGGSLLPRAHSAMRSTCRSQVERCALLPAPVLASESDALPPVRLVARPVHASRGDGKGIPPGLEIRGGGISDAPRRVAESPTMCARKTLLPHKTLALPFPPERLPKHVPRETASAISRPVAVAEMVGEGEVRHPGGDQKQRLMRMHKNWGHATHTQLCRLLKDAQLYSKDAGKCIREIIAGCEQCNISKPPPSLPHVGKHCATRLNQSVQVGLPFLGSEMFLRAMDTRTKFSLCTAIPNREQETTWKAFFTSWVAFFGKPCQIQVGAGGELKNDLRRNQCAENNIEISLAGLGAHPWVIERRHDLIRGIYARLPSDPARSGEMAICEIQRVANRVILSSGYSPYQAVFGCAEADQWGPNEPEEGRW